MHLSRPRVPLLGLAAFAALVLAAHPASAQTFTFTSGTYSADHLANDGTQGTAFDAVTLSSVSGTVTFTAGTPVVKAINGATFTVGPSYTSYGGSSYGPIPYVGSETFTLGGVTKTLTFPYSVTSNLIVDTLQFSGGNTTIFNLGALGQVAVTPQSELLSSGSGSATGFFNASFLLTPAAVPEPSSVLTFAVAALGIGGLMIAAKRKKSTSRLPSSLSSSL